LKWSGHRVSHIFANGSSSVLHQHKKTLLEAPTGTLLFGDKNIKQEIVHTLLLEEYDVSKNWVIIMDMRQDDFDSSRKNGGLITLNQRFRRRRGETAWKRRRIETSMLIVIVTLRVLTYVFSYKLSWTVIGVV